MTDLSLPYLAGYAIPHGFLLFCLALAVSSRRKAKRIRRARQELWALLEGPAPSGEVTISGIIDGSKDDGAALAVEVMDRWGHRDVVRVVHRPIWLRLDDEHFIHLELEGDADINVSAGRHNQARENGHLRTNVSFEPESRMTATGLLRQVSGGGSVATGYRRQAPRVGLSALPGRPLRLTDHDEGPAGEDFATFCSRLFAALGGFWLLVCVPFYIETTLNSPMPQWLWPWQFGLGALLAAALFLFGQGWISDDRIRVRARLDDQ